MMKTVKIILVGVLLFGIAQGVEAQFLNRLKNRIVEEAEKVVIDKAADKAAEKTGEAMDRVLSPDINIGSIFGELGSPVDVSQLPEVYRFNYLYSMKMANEGGELLFDYLLSDSESYMGIKPNVGGDITMVMDEKNNAMVTVTGGQVFAMSLNTEDSDQLPEQEIDPMEFIEDYKITELPNRTFLGYDCIGYRMENNEHSMIVYVAPDMEAGFQNVFNTKQANIPPEMKSLAKHYENGLMMYMEMEDKNNKGNKEASTTIECVAFEKTDIEIRTR